MNTQSPSLAEVRAICTDMLGYAHAVLSTRCLERIRLGLPGFQSGCSPEELADRVSEAFWARPDVNALLDLVHERRTAICTPAAVTAWLQSSAAGEAVVQAWCDTSLAEALEIAAHARRSAGLE